jgi:dipeptidase D
MNKSKDIKAYKMDTNTKRVINYFEQISKVPRGSGNEAGIREFMVNWANEQKFENKVDSTGNVLIKVPATKGMEDKPTIVLQGHLDMVCEKTPDSNHDFTKDPIKTIIEGEWMRADNTTLGADDGVALAISMALVTDSSVKHPNLELLFTVDEERGLTGANGLEEGFLSGKYLINLDSENEGVFTIGCAGGKDTHLALDLEYDEVPNDYIPFLIKVTGCTGGHSGESIHCERANAIRVLARIIQNLEEITDVRIISITGGTAHNAIPRDCEATFFAPVADKEVIESIAIKMVSIVKNEFVETDPNIQLILDENFEPCDRRAMMSWLSVKILDFLRAIPHGVASTIKKLNLTETSSNLAIVKVVDGQLLVRTSQRSSVISRRDAITSRVESVGRLAGAHVWSGNGYVPWQPNFDSKLVKQCQVIYQKLFKTDPKVVTIHAGLECGIIGDKHPGMEMISIGPDAVDIHTPTERLYLPSVGKVYELVAAFLTNLE